MRDLSLPAVILKTRPSDSSPVGSQLRKLKDMKTSHLMFLSVVLLFSSIGFAEGPPGSSQSKFVAGSFTTEAQNSILNEVLKKVPNNYPKDNAEALNKKLKELGLPQVDISSAQFSFQVSSRIGIAGNEAVGARISDGRTTYCLPCSVATNDFSWGATKQGDRLISSQAFECNGKSYRKIAKCKTDDIEACANDKKQLLELFCESANAGDDAKCESDSSESTNSCLKAWNAAHTNSCQVVKSEEFRCSSSVDLPDGSRTNNFVNVNCFREEQDLFCPKSSWSNQGYDGCIGFDDHKGIWQKCYAEYQNFKKQGTKASDEPKVSDEQLYKASTGYLFSCVAPAMEYCGKVNKDMQVTQSEFSCLRALVTRTSRNYLPKLDNTQCATTILDIVSVTAPPPPPPPGAAKSAPAKTAKPKKAAR
jgi:hypothetical protein